MRLFFLTILGFLMSACGSTQGTSSTMNKTEDLSTGDGKYIISAPIVKKSFVQKNGNETEFSEYYVQRSVQDYFIKFCEGKVTVAELEKHLKKEKGDIKSLTLEIEIKDGLWDSCDENNMVQSRTGEYIVIHRIVEE
jgi:hypothetical protein